MATLKYKLLFDGAYITPEGGTTLDVSQAATFTDLSAAQTLVEDSGAAGEYRVMTIIEKS